MIILFPPVTLIFENPEVWTDYKEFECLRKWVSLGGGGGGGGGVFGFLMTFFLSFLAFEIHILYTF